MRAQKTDGERRLEKWLRRGGKPKKVDPHPDWQTWTAEHDEARKAYFRLQDSGAPKAECETAWSTMMCTTPRRRLERVHFRLPIVRCGTCEHTLRDVWPLLVSAHFDARKALVQVPESNDPPFPMWRLALLKVAHDLPLAYPEEIEALEGRETPWLVDVERQIDCEFG